MDITGADLRRARREAKKAMTVFAGLAAMDRCHLHRVESGDRPVTPQVVEAYERVLGCSIQPATPIQVETVTVDDMLRRRELVMGVIATASVGAAATEPLTRALSSLPTSVPSRVGVSEVEAVEQAVDDFTRLDLQYGGGLALEVARGSLRWATKLLDQPMDNKIRGRLFAAVAALADRTAWSYFDTGLQGPAHQLFTLALNTSAQGDDPDLWAHILLKMSIQIFALGHREDAANLLRTPLGDSRISWTEIADLHVIRGRHFAGVNDSQAALRDLGLAEEAFAKAEPASGARWAQRVTASPGHFDAGFGLATFAAGKDKLAMEHFQAALAKLDPGRVRTAVRCQTRLAVLHMRAGNMDTAENMARLAIADAKDLRSERIRQDLAMVQIAAVEYKLRDLAADLKVAAT